MAETITTEDVRQRIGDLLNRVALRRDEFVIVRKGKRLAALVPIERLEQIRQFARRQGLDALATQGRGVLSEREADALALEAQRWARKPRRRARTRRK